MNRDSINSLVLDMRDSAALKAPPTAAGVAAHRPGLAENPILSSAMWVADAATVVVVTTVATWGCNISSSSQRHVVEVAALVAVLMFCLLLKTHRPRFRRMSGGVFARLARILEVTPLLVCSALAAAIVFVLLGWGWRQLLPAIGLWFVMSAAALAAVRAIGLYALTHPSVTKHMARKVAIVGYDEYAARVARLCEGDHGHPIRFLGIFSDETVPFAGSRLDGSVEDLIALTRDGGLDDIIIAVPPDDDALEQVAQLRWRLRGVAVEVYIMPYLAQAEDVLPVETFGPLSLMVVQRRPLTHAQAIRKRLLDLSLGCLMLILLLPVIAAIALAVKLDSPGPVLFRQPRLGFNDRPFTVLKFRSMYANAADLTAMRQTSRGDPRVTRVGKWLRKLSLDELPQLFNVLAGDMSLVGPRPHAPHTRAGGRLLKDVMAEYVVRHQVKPGITGWAQINGSRGELVTTDDLRRRVTYDLEYIQKWSIWLDLKIITATALREVFSKHAF